MFTLRNQAEPIAEIVKGGVDLAEWVGDQGAERSE
jgi:hypothetical protein